VKTAAALLVLVCAIGANAGLFVAHAAAREPALPLPPIPPAWAPMMEAPTPDLDARAPPEAARRAIVTLDLSLNHRAAPVVGDGYGPGARYKLDDDRRWLMVPGVMVRIPFP